MSLNKSKSLKNFFNFHKPKSHLDLDQARRIGFWAALAISLGSVVGIGIFLKNSSVISALTEGNSFSLWGLLVTWILAALISLLAAYSFSEIASSKQSKSGLAGWIDVLGGRKQGFFVKIMHSGMYYAIFCSCLTPIALEGLFKSIGDLQGVKIHYGWVILAGILVFISITFLNFFALKISSKIQIVGTITKLIPLILAIVVGLIGANSSHIVNNFDYNIPSDVNAKIPSTKFFDITGVFTALPGALFAFDSFLTIGNMAGDMKKPEKNVPLVAVLTIVIAAVVYILIAIGAGLTGTGSVGDILKTLFPASNTEARNAISITINIFITISAIFVVNAITMGMLKSCEGLISSNEVMFFSFFQKLNKKWDNFGSLLLFLIENFFYILLLGIPAAVMNNDAILDSATNAPTLIFFFIYAYTMILGIKDRIEIRKKKATNPNSNNSIGKCPNRVKGYVFTASIASILILVVFFYVFFYKNIYLTSLDPNKNSSSGLFFTDGVKWTLMYDAILFWVLLIWSVALPTINYFVVKKQTSKDSENRDLFIPFNWKETVSYTHLTLPTIYSV